MPLLLHLLLPLKLIACQHRASVFYSSFCARCSNIVYRVSDICGSIEVLLELIFSGMLFRTATLAQDSINRRGGGAAQHGARSATGGTRGQTDGRETRGSICMSFVARQTRGWCTLKRCRIYLQSRNRHDKKMMCSAWSALDVDDQFELNELAYWQTDAHRVKSLLSLAKKGQFCPTGSPHRVEQQQPQIEVPPRPSAELRRQGSRASLNGFE